MDTFNEVIVSVVNAQHIPMDELEKAIRIMETPFDDLLIKKRLELTEYRKESMSYDVLHDTYKKIDRSTYERIRTGAVETEGKSPVEVAEQTIKFAKTLDEAATRMEYNRSCHEAGIAILMVEVCKHMMFAGATLTEILKYVPRTRPADIYHLGERYLGYVMELSEDERRLVEEDDAKSKCRPTVDVASLLKFPFTDGIPHIKNGQWELDSNGTTVVGAPSDIAQHFVDARMHYPYKDGNGNLKFKSNFEAILEALMENPEEFSVEGCEESYSKMELDLMQRVQKKMIAAAEERIAGRKDID